MNNWVTDHEIAQEMLRGATGEIPGFLPLEQTKHFQSLNQAFLYASAEIDSILDLGCGAADFGRLYSFFDYVGADQPHIIEEVAKKKNVHLKFMTFDAYNSDFGFIAPYDLILMNAFISEIAMADEIFKKVLQKASKYVLIHRQKVEAFDENVQYREYRGYLGKIYTCAILSENYFNETLAENGFTIEIKAPSATPGEYTLLLKKEQR
jgi:hypothetical protein